MARLSPPQRRVLLQAYFVQAKINWGHIALAHLMNEGHVQRVLSVNFDSVLARACGLLGLYPAIYDFGAAPVANVKAMAEPAIIHLHGQSFGFVQLNSEQETREHAAKLVHVVRDSVQGRPLVVIGYSGQSDGVMEALCGCYDDNTNLYWVDLAEAPTTSVNAFFADKVYASFVGGADGDRFLVTLAQAIAKQRVVGGNWTPRVFHDPLQHLIDEMAPVAEFPVGRGDQSDDVLSAWRKDVARLRDDQKDAFRLTREAEAAAIQGEAELAVVQAEKANKAGAADTVLNGRRYWEGIAKGNELMDDARASSGAEKSRRLAEAEQVFGQIVTLIPRPHEAFYFWAVGLDGLSGDAVTNEQRSYLKHACDKYESAVHFRPDHPSALDGWGGALLALARQEPEPEKARLLSMARMKLMEADSVSAGSSAYNLACVDALSGRHEAAQVHLQYLHVVGRLPGRAQLESDPDLEPIRELPWFNELLSLSDRG